MYRSEIHIIKSNHILYKYCDDLCFKSKNLYNYANYLVRQEFFDNKKIVTAFDLNKQLKYHNLFRALPAKTSQHVMLQLGHNWKAFFKSAKAWVKNKDKYTGQPKPPRYKNKDGRNIVRFDYAQGSWKHNKYYFPNQKENFIQTKVNKEQFKLCEIIPYGNCYKISIIYKNDITHKIRERKNILAIDLGVNNIATLTNNIGLQPIIINGRIIKSINNYYHKKMSKAQSYAPQMSTKRTRRLSLKYANILNDNTHKISRWIVNYCVYNNIDTIIIGTTFDWKRNIHIGAKNNQTFYGMPYVQLINKISYKSEEHGINIIFIDEKYTSKASFLDSDFLPENFGEYEFSGKRVKRGLYKSANGILINADVNGSYNILRKGSPQFSYEGIAGLALIPIKINI